jgi:hypothetical protein
MPSLEPGPLGDCTAIIVAHDETTSITLLSLGQRVGFGQVTTASEPLYPLVFFLVHFGIGRVAKEKLIQQIRATASPLVQLAPIILFAPDGPYDRLLEYIEMGFDDVIFLPEKRHVLAARLAAQVDQEHIYIETGSYLGPDRRRMELPGHTHPNRGSGSFEHKRLTVLRKVDSGPQIVRTQLFLKQNHDAPKHALTGRRTA